jgi:hypothetical protein
LLRECDSLCGFLDEISIDRKLDAANAILFHRIQQQSVVKHRSNHPDLLAFFIGKTLTVGVPWGIVTELLKTGAAPGSGGEATMCKIIATVKDGRLELDVPPDWPNGTTVEIHCVQERDTLGNSDTGATTSAGALTDWLKWCDALEPLSQADAERAAWEESRRQQQDCETLTLFDWAERRRQAWS